MNDNELTQVSELIWSKLNSIENQNKDKKEQIEMIKGAVMCRFCFSQNCILYSVTLRFILCVLI